LKLAPATSTSSKVFDYKGYIRVDTATGILEFVKENGESFDLTDERGVVKYFKGSLKLSEMSRSETETARHVFHYGK
jgi:hypothetical protein